MFFPYAVRRLLIIAQKPWETVKGELDGYRRRFLELNGEEAPKPVLNAFVAMSRDRAEAQRMRETYLQRYARSTVEHYQFDRVEFAAIEGYEYYAKLAANIAKHGVEKFNSFLADLQFWGTPDEVAERLLRAVEYLDVVGALLTTLCYGGMPPAVARANYDLFVAEVLPVLKAHNVGGDIGVRYGAASSTLVVRVGNLS